MVPFVPRVGSTDLHNGGAGAGRGIRDGLLDLVHVLLSTHDVRRRWSVVVVVGRHNVNNAQRCVDRRILVIGELQDRAIGSTVDGVPSCLELLRWRATLDGSRGDGTVVEVWSECLSELAALLRNAREPDW